MLGDAAGMITPLCGNGMSIALRGSKIVNVFIDEFLQNKISREEMEKGYSKTWKQNFSRRLTIGRLLQKTFGKEWVTNRFVGFMKLFPSLTNILIRQTHGKAF
jgi:flavin-dependent dehydrogenase